MQRAGGPGGDDDENLEQKQTSVHSGLAQAAIKEIAVIRGDAGDDDDWQPRKTTAAFTEQMLADRRRMVERVKAGRQSVAGGTADADAAAAADNSETTATSVPRWSIRYYHTDHLGTPRELTGDDGSVQ